jgi:hypothetical protein
MFEQSYSNTVPIEPVYEGDFLYNYEIKSWQLTPRLYQILGASVVANIIILVIFGQASFLTAKGCDSPLVGKVCEVLDTVYVGTMLFGTDREYADVAYDPTRLSPDDDVTFVDVSNLEAPLDYPAGYFQLANPEQQFGVVDQSSLMPGYLAPGIPSSPMPSMPDLTNTPQVVPTPNPNPVEGNLPTFDNPTTTSPKTRRGGHVKTTPDTSTVANANTNSNPTLPNVNTANANTTAQQDEAAADQNGIFINKRPLTDQAKQTIADLQAKKVNLDTPFKVVVEGTLGLGPDKKTIVLKNPKLVKDPNIKNDPAIEKLVSDWILRVGDSGWLAYIDKLDDKGKPLSKKIQISLEHNDADFVATIRSEMQSENQARTASSGLGAFIGLGLTFTNGKEDEQNFLKSLKTDVQGNVLTLNFQMASPQAMDMIQRKLADLEKSVNQPNSTAVVGPTSNNAAK